MKRNHFIASLLAIPAIPAIAVAITAPKLSDGGIAQVVDSGGAITAETRIMNSQVMTLSINGQEICNSTNAVTTFEHEPIEITNDESNGWREFKAGPRTLRAVF